MNRPSALLLFLLILLPPSLCCSPPEAADSGDETRLRVFVSIPPQKFFVQRIAGELVSVDVLLPPGQSPATYEPTPRQVSRLSESTLYFRIGVPFEDRLMKKITDTMPGLSVVDTRQGIELRRMAGAHDHDQGNLHGDHVHRPGTPDPHTWLSPRLAMVQALTIHDALAQVLPASTAELRDGLDRLTVDLQRIDRRLAETLEPLRGRSIYVFHPAYGYLTDAYGLNQVAVEIEGKEPSARLLAELITSARRDGVKAIFHQPQFSRRSVETLAREIGGTAVALDPLAEDYLANLEQMAAVISDNLKTGAE
jgi:zinc transport system substrate-binding protein